MVVSVYIVAVKIQSNLCGFLSHFQASLPSEDEEIDDDMSTEVNLYFTGIIFFQTIFLSCNILFFVHYKFITRCK